MNTRINRSGHILQVITLAVVSSLSATIANGADDAIESTYIRLDNDVLGSSDEGYSNGVQLGLVSPTFSDFQDSQLSKPARWINRRLAWLQPRDFEHNNMVLTLSQSMFTPSDWRRSDPDPDDRPYAGALVLGVNYNGRNADSMTVTTLNIGVIGPAAGAREVQDLVHDTLGGDDFQGWNHQIQNEAVFRIAYQRLRKWHTSNQAGWMSDVILRGGGAVGNLSTFANLGAEARFGSWIPDNFGSAPLLPAAENSAPSARSQYSERLLIHGFIAFEVRYVLHDITLDGNTWSNSASVERKDVVGEVGIGIAAHWRGWKIALARYIRTKEFDTQRSDAELGSLTIRRDI